MLAPEHRLFARVALLPEGWAKDVRLSISKGLIQHVEVSVEPGHEDERLAVILPGLPNLHSHAFQRGMAGLTESRGPSADSFWTWREAMYRFVDRLGPDELQAIAALAYLEMLESGFTRVGEFHYLHHDINGKPFSDPAEMSRAIIAAAEETGIGLTLLPVFYAHAGFGGAALTAAQRRFGCDLEAFGRLIEAVRAAAGDSGDTVVGVAPHSLRAVTDEELAAVAPLAREGPVHIHVAEQTREVEDCLRWYGARPVQWLLDHAPVDPRWCLVHATHMTEAETSGLAASGAVAGLCPITEANLGDGVFRAEAFLGSGGRFGIGSDSNVLIDAAEELRLLEYGQRLTHHGRNVLSNDTRLSTGRTLFSQAVQGGSVALGVPSPGIAAGDSADIVSLDPDHPGFCGRDGDRLLDSWIFSVGQRGVDCVWRRGEKVVEGGRHVARPAIARRYSQVMKSLLA